MNDKTKNTWNLEDISFQIIRSNRKSLAMEITQDATVRIRAPRRTSDLAIREFILQHEEWLMKHLEIARQRRESAAEDPYQQALTEEDLARLRALAAQTIPPRVQRYADLIGVTYGRISIRHQKSRWGSCSSKGNLNFNCLLMLTPPEVQDYVIVHELCHRKQMNHSRLFWAEVEKILPDYRIREQWLKKNGGMLIRRMALGKENESESDI